jgi:hypothetical protein
MKKWMVSFFVLALLLASNARAQTTDVKDGYWLHEGRIMLLRNGELLPLTEQVALPNGLTLLPNGELVTRQGVRRNLQQGQAIDASGRILFPQTQPNGTVILVPRSAYIQERDPGQARHREAGRPAARPQGNYQSRYNRLPGPAQRPQPRSIRPQSGPKLTPGAGRGRSYR